MFSPKQTKKPGEYDSEEMGTLINLIGEIFHNEYAYQITTLYALAVLKFSLSITPQ